VHQSTEQQQILTFFQLFIGNASTYGLLSRRPRLRRIDFDEVINAQDCDSGFGCKPQLLDLGHRRLNNTRSHVVYNLQ
jgi:hypothetical protein